MYMICLHPVLYMLIVCYLVFPGGLQYVLGELLITSGCNCVGYTTTFQCTTTGNGVTKWRGTALHCPHLGNEIGLNHERFGDPDGTSKRCGEIIGQSIRVEGNNYTSQLTVPIHFKPNGTTVECVYEDLVTNVVSVIGHIRLNLTTEPFSPPDDVHLADVGQGNLSFLWSTIANNCASLQYEISTTCGVCPDITNATSVSCTISDTVSHKPKVCSFAVRSVICGDIIGRWSDHSTPVILKVPDPPIFTGIQASYDANGLTGLNVKYKESAEDMFNISSDIDGYIRNFTIVYSDGLSNHSCALLATSSLNSSLPQSCFPTLVPNNNITVTVSGFNRLGKGQENKVVIAATNQYVNLISSFERIICHGQGSYNIRSCSASYGECGKQKQWKTLLGNTTISPTVVNIDLYPHGMREYCYEITASINNITVIIMKGNHNYSADADGHVHSMLIALVTIFTALVLSMVVLSICITVAFRIYRKYHPSGFHKFELLDQPWQLLKLLRGLKELDISINETKFGECTSKGTRNVYMRFDRDPLNERAEHIKRQIDELKLLTLNQKIMDSKATNVHVIGSHSKLQYMYKYKKCLPPRPGALYSLILGIKGLSSSNNNPYSEINCNFTGIEGTPKGEPGHIEICLTFVCEHQLPEDWKEDFDNIIIC